MRVDGRVVTRRARIGARTIAVISVGLSAFAVTIAAAVVEIGADDFALVRAAPAVMTDRLPGYAVASVASLVALLGAVVAGRRWLFATSPWATSVLCLGIGLSTPLLVVQQLAAIPYELSAPAPGAGISFVSNTVLGPLALLIATVRLGLPWGDPEHALWRRRDEPAVEVAEQ